MNVRPIVPTKKQQQLNIDCFRFVNALGPDIVFAIPTNGKKVEHFSCRCCCCRRTIPTKPIDCERHLRSSAIYDSGRRQNDKRRSLRDAFETRPLRSTVALVGLFFGRPEYGMLRAILRSTFQLNPPHGTVAMDFFQRKTLDSEETGEPMAAASFYLTLLK